MANNPPRARENAALHLCRAGWHCPEKFQSNQNKQHTCREENLKQTFGSHLDTGSYAGNSALKFRILDHVRKKHTRFQDFTFLFPHWEDSRVVCRKSEERLLSTPVHLCESWWDAHVKWESYVNEWGWNVPTAAERSALHRCSSGSEDDHKQRLLFPLDTTVEMPKKCRGTELKMTALSSVV